MIVHAADQHGNENKGKFDVIILDPLDGAELTPSTNVLEYSNKMTDRGALTRSLTATATAGTPSRATTTLGGKACTS